MTRKTNSPTTCRRCSAPIVFLLTSKGRSMPVEYSLDVSPEDTHFDAARHVSHFANCPAAKEFRRRHPK